MQNKKSSGLFFIFITVVIDVIGLGIIIPVMPKLIQELTGGDLSEASRYGGWLVFTYAITQFVFASGSVVKFVHFLFKASTMTFFIA